MRFYPPWCTKFKYNAQSTQKWQLKFLEKLNYKNDFEKFLVDSYQTQRFGSFFIRTNLCVSFSGIKYIIDNFCRKNFLVITCYEKTKKFMNN